MLQQAYICMYIYIYVYTHTHTYKVAADEKMSITMSRMEHYGWC